MSWITAHPEVSLAFARNPIEVRFFTGKTSPAIEHQGARYQVLN